MADLVKIFYEVGKAYKDEVYDNYNQIHSKNIEKIVTFDLTDNDYRPMLYDRNAIVERFFLRVTSSNGGNLYPFLFLSDKVIDGVKKAFKNMGKYLDKEDKKRLKEIEEKIDYKKLEECVHAYIGEKNIYLGLLYEGKTFNELFPVIIDNYIQNVCKGDVELKANCYIDGEGVIGFDAGLNFCSVNELPTALRKSTKYRLLPLSKEAACLVKQGFQKVFEEQIFRFYLFGHSYYLLPTLFIENKRAFFEKLEATAKEPNQTIREKYALERRLERLVKELEGEKISQKVLFSFLFADKNNNAIDLYQMIEDVAPSRISIARQLMKNYAIESANYSRFTKKGDHIQDAVYVRDYIDDSLFLAKLIFGKESIPQPSKIEAMIAKKILYGHNGLNYEKREFSKVLGGYFKDDIDFEKHQRFIDFLESLGVLSFGGKNFIDMEVMMEDVGQFSELAEQKFAEVELLKKPKVREFYALGALAQFVMNWQYANNSDALAKYLDGIGAITMQNVDRVFRKVYEASRKYGMGGKDYDDLMNLYVQAKEAVKKEDVISIDQANIAFVMGSINYKNYKESKKAEGEQK
jgi:hypothetical protein